MAQRETQQKRYIVPNINNLNYNFSLLFKVENPLDLHHPTQKNNIK